jgi:3-methylcrotonyl-CoA carboxylase alpha subunit
MEGARYYRAMFKSVLIANRGEIAVRIIRTARALGMRTIAVYSEADRDALHVKLADEAHYIGGAAARQSYLDVTRIIEAARKAKAECLHPGYGFLSERPELAEGCAVAGIVFVGPPPAAMRLMGSKSEAKALMEKARVPVVPGYHGERQDTKFLREKAYETGYPVLIKAAAGGGGKGMRIVTKAIEFEESLLSAQREAEAAFGDDRILIEKVIENPRHVEVQIFADNHGGIVHLFERDCSLQRRHQKVMEEAPAPGIADALREEITSAAISAARVSGYRGAGTVEFIVDPNKRSYEDGSFYFLEMNTRLQVEHPVTEAVTGVDRVEWQFRVAAGEKLPLTQNEIRLKGHAVEARIYAEDPENNFLPSPGKLYGLHLPQGDGIRIDSGVEEGDEISAHYDPMIAKIVAHAPSREGAFNRLAHALAHTVVAGPRGNVAFLHALATLPPVREGKVDTGLIAREGTSLGTWQHQLDCAAVARGAAFLIEREQQRIAVRARRRSNEKSSPWNTLDAFGFGGVRETNYALSADAKRVTARVRFDADGMHVSVNGTKAADCPVISAGEKVIAWHKGRQTVVMFDDHAAGGAAQTGGDGVIVAPMHGKVLAVFVSAGERVKKGQRIGIIEAMKMEHAIVAPIDGEVAELAVAAGDQVAERAKIAVIKELVQEESVKAEAE